MKRMAITGYASLDHPVVLDGMMRGDQTTIISGRDRATWPRLGGCVSYVARAVALAGQRAEPVTWIGDDANGKRYREMLGATGAALGGVGVLAGGATPLSILIHQGDGSCVCLFDRGLTGQERLSGAQTDILAGADLVCITVGPPAAIAEVLSLLRPEATLALVFKNDASSFPAAALRKAAERAAYLFCNASERRAITDAGVAVRRAGLTLIETAGADGLTIRCAERSRSLRPATIEQRDTTGAGDTLAGGFLAAVLAGEDDPVAAAEAGIEAASALLRTRHVNERNGR